METIGKPEIFQIQRKRPTSPEGGQGLDMGVSEN